MKATILGLVVSSLVTGDLGGNQGFDLTDYAAFPGCLSGDGVEVAVDCSAFDFDRDGDVDLVDFSRVQQAFGLSVPPGTGATSGGERRGGVRVAGEGVRAA